jgi:kynurenine formamidase
MAETRGDEMCVAGCERAVRDALTRRGFFKGATVAGFAATTMTGGAVAAAPRSFAKVVDLTHPMSGEFPTFNGKPGIEVTREFALKKDGYNLSWWHLSEHAGTHIDAPIHFSEHGAALDALAVEQLVVPLVVVDIAYKAEQEPDYLLSRDDLAAWEAKNGRLPDNCCVALYSGWGELLAKDEAKFSGRDIDGTFHFPGFDPDAAEWMIRERRVAGIAVDTLSLDNGPSKEFATHKMWLPSGRWGLENVANLGQVPASGATLVVGAPKVKGASGGLTRVFALV